MIYISSTIGSEENNWHDNDGNVWVEISFKDKKPNLPYLNLFRTQWKEKHLPNFEVGALYRSIISFFMFRTSLQLFERTTDAESLEVWMGERFNPRYALYFTNPNLPFSQVPTLAPFVILREIILVRLYERQKLHLFEVLYGEKTGWISAPNQRVSEIEKCFQHD